MSYKRKGLFLMVLLFLLLSFCKGMAQEKGGSKSEGKAIKTERAFGFTTSRAPIDIISDTVEADQKKNTVTFKGNVIAKQEDTTLYANTLIITYDQTNKRLKEIIAVGNVKVVQLDRRATGQRATFDPDKNKIVLDGEAVIREGANVIRGERIIFFMDEERSIVEGGKGGRVTTSITPPSKEEGEEKRK